MNKILILLVGLLIIVGGYFFLGGSDEKAEPVNGNIIDSSYGFSFTPPEGWSLWLGLSAVHDASNEDSLWPDAEDGEYPAEKIQDYINIWIPRDSQHLTYTSSDVDVASRDINYIAGKVGVAISEDPLLYNNVDFEIKQSPVDYTEEEKSNDTSELSYIELLGERAKFIRIKAFDTHDVVWISFPIDTNTSLNILRSIDKNISNDDVLNFYNQFLLGLEIN